MYKVSSDAVTRDMTEHEHTLLSHAHQTRSLPNAPLHSGRFRWLPDGVEHDLLYRDERSKVTRRVTLFRRLNNAHIVRSIDVDDTKLVHILLTLKGRLDKYTTFLEHLTTSVLPNDPNLTLTITYFTDSQLEQARNLTTHYLAPFPKFQWSLVPLSPQGHHQGFSRGKGLHVGALNATEKEGDVLFFSDVDVLPKPDFFTRCRANTVLGRQVYYPILFSLYNPKLVYPLQDAAIPPIPQRLTVGDDTGFWREFGYGMACVAMGDYRDTGGYRDIRVWGGEDEALYQQFLAKEHIKVIRAPDPSLFHLHHDKQCESTGDAAFVSCLRSRATTQGSKMQLGMALLKIQDGTDLEGVLSKRFYYFWLVPYLGGLLLLSLLTNVLLAYLLLLCNRRPSQGCKVL